MPMPFSGAISFDNFRTEWGITGSISMSQMYRGGFYVDATNREYGTFSSYDGPSGLTDGSGDIVYGSNLTAWVGRETLSSGFYDPSYAIWWNDALVLENVPGGSTSYDIGGYQYEEGTYVSAVDYEAGGFRYAYHSIRRRTYTDVDVNTNVPTSGQIDLQDLYGAQDY
jgi:hypothetical protein